MFEFSDFPCELCPGSSSDASLPEAIVRMEEGVPKMTGTPVSGDKILFGGKPHLMVFTWKELLVRLYPLSDNGQIDESRMHIVRFTESYIFLNHVSAKTGGSEVLAHDYDSLKVYATSDSSLLSSTPMSPFSYRKLLYGHNFKPNMFLVSTHSSDEQMYSWDDLTTPVWSSSSAPRVGGEFLYFFAENQELVFSAKSNDGNIRILDKYIGNFASSDFWPNYNVNGVLSDVYSGGNPICDYLWWKRAGGETTHSMNLVRYTTNHLARVKGGTLVSAFWGDSRSDDGGRLVFGLSDSLIYSDEATIQSHLNYGPTGTIGSSDQEGYLGHVVQQGIFFLRGFDYVLAAGVESWLDMGAIRTWNQEFPDINRPPDATIAAHLAMVYFDDTKMFVVTKLNEAFLMSSDGLSVLNQVQFKRFIMNAWEGRDSREVFFLIARQYNYGYPRFKTYVFSWDIYTGATKKLKSGFGSSLSPGSYPVDGFSHYSWAYGGLQLVNHVLVSDHSLAQTISGAFADSIDADRSIQRSYVKGLEREWVYEIEGYDTDNKLLRDFGFVKWYDYGNVFAQVNGPPFDSFGSLSLVHYATTEKIYGVRVDQADSFIYETSGSDGTDLSFTVLSGIGLYVSCTKITKTLKDTQSICFHHSMSNIYGLDFSTGAPVIVMDSVSINSDEFFSQYNSLIFYMHILEAHPIPSTNYFLTLTNVGMLKWDFNLLSLGSMNTNSCELPCVECTEVLTECIKCSTFAVTNKEFEGSCLSDCPSDTFIVTDQGGYLSCEACLSPCAECDSSATHCTKCLSDVPDNILQLDGTTCSDSCPPSSSVFLYDNGNLRCDRCLAPCEECEGSPSECTLCLSDAILNIKQFASLTCSDSCSPGTFIKKTDRFGHKECESCDPSCATCLSADGCLTCYSDWFFSAFDGFCEAECSPNSFMFGGECLTSCPSGMFHHEGLCIDQCPTGFYGLEGTCTENCPYNYLILGTDCVLECPDAFGPPLDSKVCEPCDLSCATCFNSLSNGCKTCPSGFVIHPESGLCLVECLSNCYSSAALDGNPFGIPSGTATCMKCKYPCKTCQDSATNCVTCPDKMTLNTLTNKCEVTLDITCEFPCLTCTEPTVCKSCESGYTLNATSQTCSELGSSCPDNCLSCLQKTNECIECVPGFYNYEGSCVTKCPEGWSRNQRTRECKECSRLNCKECQEDSADICIKCDKNYFLKDNGCVSSCPTGYLTNSKTSECIEGSECKGGYYLASDANECLPCQKHCEECSKSICFSCFHGYKLNSGVCELASTYGFPKSSLYSDGVQGKIWDSQALTNDAESYSEINPIFSTSYSPSTLSVVFIIKSEITNKETSSFPELFEALLTGYNQGQKVTFEPSSFERSYVTISSTQVELKVKFEINQTLTDAEVKMWIDPSVIFEPKIHASLFSKSVGRLEYLSTGQVAAATATGSLMGVTSVVTTAISCFAFAINPTFALMIPETMLLSSYNIETPASLSLVSKGISYGYSLSFLPSITTPIDNFIFQRHLKRHGSTSSLSVTRRLQDENSSSTETDNETSSSVTENQEGQTPSDTMSYTEKEKVIAEIMLLPNWLNSMGIGPLFWTNIAGQLIILGLLSIPLLISLIKKKKDVDPAKPGLINKIKWKLPIFFLIIQTQFFVISIFSAFRASTEKYAFSLFSAFVAFLFGVFLLFLLLQFLLLVLYYRKKAQAQSAMAEEAQRLKEKEPLNPSQTANMSQLLEESKERDQSSSMLLNEETKSKETENKLKETSQSTPATSAPAEVPQDFDFIFSKYKIHSFSSRLFAFMLLFSNAAQAATTVLLTDYPGLAIPITPAFAFLQVLYCFNFQPFLVFHKVIAFTFNKSILIVNYILLFIYGYVLVGQDGIARDVVLVVFQVLLVFQALFNLFYYIITGAVLPIVNAIKNKKKKKLEEAQAQKPKEQSDVAQVSSTTPQNENFLQGLSPEEAPEIENQPQVLVEENQNGSINMGNYSAFGNPNSSNLDDSKTAWFKESPNKEEKGDFEEKDHEIQNLKENNDPIGEILSSNRLKESLEKEECNEELHYKKI